MKKSLTALALALALAGTLAACSTDKNPNNGTAGNNGTTAGGTSGTASGSMNGTTGSSASGTPGTVSRRYGGQSVYNGRIYNEPTYFDDGRYAAGTDGRVYGNDGNTVSRDLTQGAGNAVEDVGRGIGNAARDITGTNANPGTPSWEPDSSAVRY